MSELGLLGSTLGQKRPHELHEGLHTDRSGHHGGDDVGSEAQVKRQAVLLTTEHEQDTSDSSDEEEESAVDAIPVYEIPLRLHGWTRERCQRSKPGRDGQPNFDIYYSAPGGRKLRSHKELEAFLSHWSPRLTTNMFTFNKRDMVSGTIERQSGPRQAKEEDGPLNEANNLPLGLGSAASPRPASAETPAGVPLGQMHKPPSPLDPVGQTHSKATSGTTTRAPSAPSRYIAEASLSGPWPHGHRPAMAAAASRPRTLSTSQVARSAPSRRTSVPVSKLRKLVKPANNKNLGIWAPRRPLDVTNGQMMFCPPSSRLQAEAKAKILSMRAESMADSKSSESAKAQVADDGSGTQHSVGMSDPTEEKENTVENYSGFEEEDEECAFDESDLADLEELLRHDSLTRRVADANVSEHGKVDLPSSSPSSFTTCESTAVASEVDGVGTSTKAEALPVPVGCEKIVLGGGSKHADARKAEGMGSDDVGDGNLSDEEEEASQKYLIMHVHSDNK